MNGIWGETGTFSSYDFPVPKHMCHPVYILNPGVFKNFQPPLGTVNGDKFYDNLQQKNNRSL